MTEHGCRFVPDYCPPEIVAAHDPGSRDNTHHLNTAVEVFIFGLILAEVAGASRLYPKERPDYTSHLTQMCYDSWVKVSSCMWMQQPLM